MALGKFTLREVRTRPGRAILTLLSVVIGVAMVVSVSIATQTTRRANKDMYETLTGRASLEVTAAAGTPFSESVLKDVADVDGVAMWTFKQPDGSEHRAKAAAPIIRLGAKMFYHQAGEKPATPPVGTGQAVEAAEPAAAKKDSKGKFLNVDVQILGIDPDLDGAVRDYTLIAGQMIDVKNKILMDSNFARGLGLKVKDPVRFRTTEFHDRLQFLIAGLIAPRGAAALGQGVIYMPLKSAQKLLNIPGEIHAIQVVTADDADVAEVQDNIAKILPEGLIVRPSAMRTRQAEETLLSTELALKLATFFSWGLAFLIVLNTFQMNVVERRRQLAILRAIGATRGQIMGVIFREGLCMGLLGTVLGLLAGVGGAILISSAMGKVMQANLPPIEITWQPLVIAALVGPAVSVFGALLPAWMASRLTPLEGMGAILPSEMEAPRWTMFLIGVLVSLTGATLLALCLRGVLPVNGSVLSTLTILVGVVMMIPMALQPLTSGAAKLLSPLLRVEGRLAKGQIVRRRGRTTLTVGVLFLAVAFGIGMAMNIVDNVANVRNWARTTITGDFFIRGSEFTSKVGDAADVPESMKETIEKIDGVDRVLTVRSADIVLGDQTVKIIVSQFGEPNGRQLDIIEGDPHTMRAQLEAGNAIIGSVLASRANLKMGDTIPLEGLPGQKPPVVVGIANEYMGGGMTIHMRPKQAAETFGITGLNAYVIKVKPGHLDQVGAVLTGLAQDNGLLLQTQRDLLMTINGMIAGLVGCLWALLVLVLLVAAFGVVNTLTMNVIEQTRELGLLRIVAMTRNQVRKMIVSQATLLAVIGLAPGIAAGMALAWFMNMSLETLTGRTIAFDLHPVVVGCCFAAAFAIVLAAAWFPANRAAKLKLAEALQYQ